MAQARIIALEKQALATDLAKLIVDAQKKAVARKGRFDIAVSGGSQAETLAEGLLNNPEVEWTKWHVWFADERIVPLDHEDSNFMLFEKHVLLRLPESSRPIVHPISKELLKNNEKATSKQFAADYQQLLVRELGTAPALDFAVLGMGPDGHTCSLFPGHALLKEATLFVSHLDDSPKPPKSRITLTKPALELVDQIVFLATGAAKKDAIHAIFKDNDTSLPSKQVNDLAKNEVVWLTDNAALGN